MIKRISLLLLLIYSFSFASLDLTTYYGEGCPHCARTTALLSDLADEYNLSIEEKEIYFNAQNRQEMFDLYTKFGLDPMNSGVPTTLVNDESLVVGEMSRVRWEEVFNNTLSGKADGVYTQNSFSPIEEKDLASQLTIPVLIGAALVDSVNPCTIAVMVMLLGVILLSKGKRETLLAGIAFALTIYVMYLLMGLGILHAVTSTELTNGFYGFVTIAAFVLAVFEIRAYFRYRPGFFAIEMPMFIRPHAKKLMQGATSIPGVMVAAAACSFFLLPCSSGPYLLVLGMLAKSATLQALLYLLLYNFIFIIPMIIIAFSIYVGRAKVEDVHELKERYIREIHLFSGLILLALFLVLVYQMFTGI